jgi:hypothetical protein
MTGLHIVRKRDAATALDARTDRVLRQLAAMERAGDAIDQACDHLSNAWDRAAKLRSKIQSGVATFLDTWNASTDFDQNQAINGAHAAFAELHLSLGL